MDTQVLIVGAGPTGLMMANQLARRGIKPLLIDRHGGPAQQTRAMGVQARTLEIYAKLGIADEAVRRGAVTRGVNLWSGANHKARVPVGDAGQGLSPFPFVLMLGQDENERILGDKLRALGVSVQWSTELLSLCQFPDHVTASLKMPDGGTREVQAAWVAGCDGSRSAVRSLCGIDFPGAPYEHVFFVADTTALGDMVPAELNAYLWRKGFHLFFPMHGENRWRVIGILPADLRERDDLRFEDVIPHLRREVGTRLEFRSCHWFSTYRIQHRHAERFRDGRCFLLGDAAHIHSPMGAQGMNTGLQDAYNLAWKLAAVTQGQAAECLLDSYQDERQRVAQALLRGTDRAFGLVVSDTPLAAFFRTRIMGNGARLAMRFKRVQRVAYRTISQVGIRYRHSFLSKDLRKDAKDGPRAGDRFPWMRLRFAPTAQEEDVFARLDDTQFNLLLFGQHAGTPPAHAMVRIHEVPMDAANARTLAAAGITGQQFFLLRPDGHIALAGTDYDPVYVRHYLASLQEPDAFAGCGRDVARDAQRSVGQARHASVRQNWPGRMRARP